MKFLFTTGFILSFLFASAQDTTFFNKNLPEVNCFTEKDTIYLRCDIMPEFSGGYSELIRYLQRELKYPKKALQKGIEGTVSIGFTVQKDGSVSDIKVLKGITEGGLREEALRVVSKMPLWKPGMKDGKPVATRLLLPITFTLPK